MDLSSMIANNWQKLLVFTVMVAILAPSTGTSQLANGTVTFKKSPRLLDAVTTYNSVRVWGSTYYFTVELPKEAVEPLGKVIISQRQGTEDINFLLEKSKAFEGRYTDKGKELTLKTVTRDDRTKAISIVFDPPVVPGTTFSIGLKPKRNPDYEGIYLYGVTAFPAGKNPLGLYLGVGRLHFYGGTDVR